MSVALRSAPAATPAPAATKPDKKPYLDDKIFFSKARLIIGQTRFRNVGERERGTIWLLTGIETHFITDNPGVFDWKQSDHVRLFDDILTLECTRRGITRRVRYGRMKYSAIWRLV